MSTTNEQVLYYIPSLKERATLNPPSDAAILYREVENFFDRYFPRKHTLLLMQDLILRVRPEEEMSREDFIKEIKSKTGIEITEDQFSKGDARYFKITQNFVDKLILHKLQTEASISEKDANKLKGLKVNVFTKEFVNTYNIKFRYILINIWTSAGCRSLIGRRTVWFNTPEERIELDAMNYLQALQKDPRYSEMRICQEYIYRPMHDVYDFAAMRQMIEPFVSANSLASLKESGLKCASDIKGKKDEPLQHTSIGDAGDIKPSKDLPVQPSSGEMSNLILKNGVQVDIKKEAESVKDQAKTENKQNQEQIDAMMEADREKAARMMAEHLRGGAPSVSMLNLTERQDACKMKEGNQPCTQTLTTPKLEETSGVKDKNSVVNSSM